MEAIVGLLGGLVGAALAIALVGWNGRGWIEAQLGKARHSKDEELQEYQSQIDLLQVQVRELQIACRSLNGNHFTRTPP